MYSIGLNKYFTSLPKIHDCLSPPNLGLDQRVTQGVLDNCRRLASGYRLRKVIVLFPTMDRFFNQRSKATLLNRRRTLGRTFRQMDTLSHIGPTCIQKQRHLSLYFKKGGDQSFVVISFLTATLVPNISRYLTPRWLGTF